jgi:phage tail sheath protein FI
MPVEYLTPGVYVEEVSSGLKPIQGVGTNTAGFIGEVADAVQDTMPAQPGKFEMEPDPADPTKSRPKLKDGKPIPVPYTLAPAGEPQLITSWEQFKTRFGDFQDGNKILAHAIYGFYNNGGTRAWITRVKPASGGGKEDFKPYFDALDRFRRIDEIALVAIPGHTDDEVQGAVISHCEDENLQDRFAILDGKRVTTLTPDTIKGVIPGSSYGAIYYPWIQVYDPVSKGRIYVPPSGHLAGIYARVDEVRGVHKAPANEIVRGALGVGVPGDKPENDASMILNKADQGGLNPQGVNVIRKFDGNITVWGARTLASEADPEWRYINVRRLFLFLRKSLDHGTQWVVFEPNNQALWGKIVREISDFLRRVWRSGALFGLSESEAFYVKCDETNNPREVRDAGQVIIEVGVAVVKPAEFVIIRISQWAGPNPG